MAAPGVLANDTDPDSDPLTVFDYTQPTNGSVTVNADGSFDYTPDPGFNGADSFDYVVADGNDGTVHHWKLDGDGTDSVGASNGTVTGTTTVAGHYGNALSFNAAGDHVMVPDFTYTDEFSVSFRFKIDDIGGTDRQSLYSHGAQATANSLNIEIRETGNGSFPGELRTNFMASNDVVGANNLNFDVSGLQGDGL